jgi:DNA (cytosine-5)-methyltransferase 1
MSKPRLLDLFCGAGGAAMGYHQAGFEVVGVDIEPRPLFPFEFMQHDAMTLDPEFLARFDAIHASPPCQAYTGMQALNTRAPKRDHPKLIMPVRAMLIASGLPYVIENVAGAKKEMIEPYVLCGSMFGLGVRRHRLFETSFFMLQPKCQHDRGGVVPVWGDGRPTRQEVRKARRAIAVYGDHPQEPGNKPNNVNRARTLAEGQEAMGIDWMDWRTLTQAIPPAYTRFIGEQLMAHLGLREAA